MLALLIGICSVPNDIRASCGWVDPVLNSLLYESCGDIVTIDGKESVLFCNSGLVSDPDDQFKPERALRASIEIDNVVPLPFHKLIIHDDGHKWLANTLISPREDAVNRLGFTPGTSAPIFLISANGRSGYWSGAKTQLRERPKSDSREPPDIDDCCGDLKLEVGIAPIEIAELDILKGKERPILDLARISGISGETPCRQPQKERKERENGRNNSEPEGVADKFFVQGRLFVGLVLFCFGFYLEFVGGRNLNDDWGRWYRSWRLGILGVCFGLAGIFIAI